MIANNDFDCVNKQLSQNSKNWGVKQLIFLNTKVIKTLSQYKSVMQGRGTTIPLVVLFILMKMGLGDIINNYVAIDGPQIIIIIIC